MIYTYSPKLAIRSNERDLDHFKDEMNMLEEMGRHQTRLKQEKYQAVYKLLKGEHTIDFDNLKSFRSLGATLGYTKDNLTELLEKLELEDYEHFDFIGNIVEIITQVYLESETKVNVDAVDEVSRNNYLQLKTDLMYDSLDNLLQAQLRYLAIKRGLDPNVEDMSEEEKNQMLEQLEALKQEYSLSKVETKLQKNYKNVAIEFAQQTKKEDEARFDFQNIIKTALLDFLVSGSYYINERIGLDFYRPELWRQYDVFIDINEEETNPHKAEMLGRRRWLKAHDIIKDYGSYLTSKQQEALINNGTYRMEDDIQHQSIDEYLRTFGGDVYLDFPERQTANRMRALNNIVGEDTFEAMFGIKRPTHDFTLSAAGGNFYNYNIYDRYEVTEAYYTTYKLVGFVRYEKDGEILQEIVTDELNREFKELYGIKLKTVSAKEFSETEDVNIIVWQWMPEKRWGLKINQWNTKMDDAIYVGGDTLPRKIIKDSKFYGEIIPVSGVVNRKSRLKQIAQHQTWYNMIMNDAKSSMERNLGYLTFIDYRYISGNYKGDGGEDTFNNFFSLARNWGFVPMDFSSENVQGSQQQTQPFSVVNASNVLETEKKLQFAKIFKAEAYQELGIAHLYSGQTITQEQNGQEMTTLQTSPVLESIFDEFTEGLLKFWEVHIEYAKYAKVKKIDNSDTYAQSDMIRAYLDNVDLDIIDADLRIYHINNAGERKKVLEAKQIALQNTVDASIESRMEILNSSSMAEIIEISRQLEQKRIEMQQRQQEFEQQMQQQKNQAEAQRIIQEHRQKMEEIELKGRLDIQKAAMVATGFQKDPENIDDIMKSLKMTLQMAEQQSNEMMNEQKLYMDSLKMDNEQEHKSKQLELKQRELDIKEKAVDTNLAVAVSNKNKYDFVNK